MPQFINKRSTIFILILLVSCIVSCAEIAGMDSHSSISRFKHSEDLYKASLRWGEWINIFQLQRPRDSDDISAVKPPSEALLTHLAHIKVTHTETLSSGINEDKATGQTLFLIEYHFDNSAKIQTIRHKVDWWYDSENNIWFTNTSLPKEFDVPETAPGTIKLSPKNSSGMRQ